VGIHLVPVGPASVVLDTPFGYAGVGDDDATYSDFRFDLTQLPLFAAPLAAGDWVLELQSKHDTACSGSLRVHSGSSNGTGSGAEQCPLPTFRRDKSIPPRHSWGRDPDIITLHWEMSPDAIFKDCSRV